MKTIILAGGCFWGVEAYFKQLEGIKDTTVGYIDGMRENPSYEDVCSGSGHAEAVHLTYDPNDISLTSIMNHYLNIVDLTKINRQGPDIGRQYRSGIYNYDDEQKEAFMRVLDHHKKQLNKPIYIDLKPKATFYEAEDNHQDYLDKNPSGYCHVNLTSVRNVKE